MAVKIFSSINPLNYNEKNIAIGGGVSLAKTIASSIVIPDSEQEKSISNSYLGTPVIDNLEFSAGSYKDLNGVDINYNGVIIDTVTLEVNRTKRIIETNIQGRDNSVFEYIGNSNYEVTCSGIISVKENLIPIDIARDLQKIFDVPQQVRIVSRFLNDIFEIFDVVIKTNRISQQPGMINSIPFSFTASQDVSIEVNELE